MTVVVRLLAADCVTVKTAVVVPVLPSVTVTLLIDRVSTPSSFTIVPRPWPSRIVALPGLDRFTTNVSSGSTVVSPMTGTVIVPVVAPAAMVSVPLVAV